MNSIARVIVDIALDREFDYRIPDDMASAVSVGSRVTVPFGKSRTSGYVVGFSDQPARHDLKNILSVVGDKSYASQKLLDLARWMGEYYCAPFEQAVRTILPGAVRRHGAKFKTRQFVELAENAGGEASPSSGSVAELTEKQAKILDVLRLRGSLLFSDLVKEAGVTSAPVHALVKKGRVRILDGSVRRAPLANRNILRTPPLVLMPEQAAALKMVQECVDLGVPASGGRQAPAAAVGGVCESAVPAASEIGYGDGGPSPSNRNAGKEEQRCPPHVVLLYGVTGSGKTEVYLQGIDYVLQKGGGAIILVPEISLTPQTVERFLARFGDRIAVLHSHLSEGERHDEWHRIRDGKADIVIGARSAVFAPVRNLGLIVVDEEHEPSYKQEEAPRYNARDVAVMRGRREGCAVLLGSATPSMESWFNAKKGKYRLAELPHRADNRKMPHIRIVDMRLQKEGKGRAGIFSPDLLEAIRKRIEKSEQTILFLNRRGFATSLQCPLCGFVARCENCSVAYTYHLKDGLLRCHICGAARKAPVRCPGCQDPSFRYAGVGTQRVESVMAKHFPHARIQRMDADVTTRKDSYDRIFGDFRVGKIDILIGTQMIAKGLHFPNVTLVGVIYADLSLHMPDFRAGERTFQLLAQVAGRAGRGEVPGEVIVQTYTPQHTAVQAARRVDFSGFCDQEFEFRKELLYPPVSHLVCIHVKGRVEEKVSFCAAAIMRALKRKLPKSVMLGEATPAPLARAKGFYRYQILLRSTSVKAMIGPMKEVLAEIKLPKGVSHVVDVDAISLL